MVVLERQFENDRYPLRTLISRVSSGGLDPRSDLQTTPISDIRGEVINELETPRTILSPSESMQLADDFLSGMKVPALVKKYGVNRSTVYDHLAEHGIRPKKNVLTNDRVDRAVRLYEAGMTLAEVAKEIGSNRTTVGAALKSRGIPRRPQGVRVPFDPTVLSMM